MSKAGSRILEGARQALAFARGDVTGCRVYTPTIVDVRAIRRKLGLSRQDFAMRYGFALDRLRDWEEGRASVDMPSRILLMVIDKEPDAVDRALQSLAPKRTL